MPSVCRTGARRLLFKARVVGSKPRLGRGFETNELAGTKPHAQSYRTSLLPAGACPPLIDHTSHLHGWSPYDLTPTHYGIGSETPNLKPTGFTAVKAIESCKSITALYSFCTKYCICKSVTSVQLYDHTITNHAARAVRDA